MNTNYPTSNFNYNTDFHYDYNIFNNQNIGIGTFNPQHTLDIKGNLATTGNINIHGNMIFKNKYPNQNKHFLEYNINTNTITPLKLIDQPNSFNANKYEWTQSNNNLSLKFYNKRDNTPIQFQSIEYKIDISNDKQIYFYSKYKISITHLFIYDKNTEQFSNTDYSQVTVNTIGNQKLANYYYKLNTPIILQKHSNNTINIHNGNSTYPFYIILLGQYEFNNSLLWNTNTSLLPNNVYIFNKIGIGTSIISKQLHIQNDAKISENISIDKNITTHTSNITNIINHGISTIDSITSNKLIINSKQKNIGIGTTHTKEFFDVSNEFIINSNNNTFFNIQTNSNTIYFNSTINSISHNHNNILIFNNVNNKHNIISKNLHISKPYQNNSTPSQSLIHFQKNLNLSNINKSDTNNVLYVKGNTTISKNLNVNGNLNINNIENFHISTLNSSHLKNISHTLSKNLIYSNDLQTTNTTNTILTLPKITDTSNMDEGTLVYNTTDNKIYGKSDSTVFNFASDNGMKNQFNYDFNGISELLYTQSDQTDAKKHNVSKKLILPKKHTYSTSNTNKINVGSFQYNTNSLYGEIFNGTQWTSIKYNNSDSELNYLTLDNSTLLTPSFNSRLFNYSYNSILTPTFMNIIFNPYTTNTYNFKYNTTSIFSKTITTTDYTFENIDMKKMTNANKVIITSSNSQNDTLTYQCDFNFTSPIRDFLNKYNSFKIIHKINTTNDYIIRPIFGNGLQLNLSSIQTKTGTTPVITANNRVYYEYSDATKFVTINSTFNKNDLRNTYYDRTTKKFYLGDPKNNNTELIFTNNNITSGYYIPDYSPTIINTEAYENELTNAFYDPTQDKFFITTDIELTTLNDTIVYSIDTGITCKIKYFNS
tara:strand:- start:1702 stop:4341 length:2640 start_codon:yes stop_codon:yes gene_type:complete